MVSMSNRRLAPLGLVSALLLTSGADAQDPSDEDPVTENVPASDDPGEQGRVLFQRGITFLERGDLTEALSAFEASHRVQPSTAALYNVALLLADLERRAEAWNRFREYLTLDVEIGADKRRNVELLMGELAESAGLIDFLIVPVFATVTVDERTLTDGANSTWALEPGSHRVLIEADGYTPWEVELTVLAGSRRTLSRTLRPVPVVAPEPTEPTEPTEPSVVETATQDEGTCGRHRERRTREPDPLGDCDYRRRRGRRPRDLAGSR